MGRSRGLHNRWKTFALGAAGAACLGGALLALLRGPDPPRSAEDRANVAAYVRFLLSRGDTAKAEEAVASFPQDPEGRAAADDTRFEIAAACPPERAARLLDAIDVASKNPGAAARVAQARLDAYRRLFQERVLHDGAVPTPYEPAPYSLAPRTSRPPGEMSRVASRLLACISEQGGLTRRRGGAADPSLARLESLARATQYALGDIPYEEVHPLDEESRVRFGDALYRERQFDRAIAVWTPVLGDPRVQRKLAELAALRRLAPAGLHVWDYDLDALPARDAAIEAEATTFVEGLFRGARPGKAPTASGGGPEAPPREVHATDEPTIFFPEADRAAVSRDALLHDPTYDPEQIYLLRDHRGFRLEAPDDRSFTTRSGASLHLTSVYRGPIRFRLYRVPHRDTLEELTEETLVARRSALTLVREWEKEFAPLRENGERSEKAWTIAVPCRAPGLFVLMADARYSPVYAAVKYIVTDVALVQHVALDRVLLYAADRTTGAPVPSLALAGEITGRYDLSAQDILPADDAGADEYRRGFSTAWEGKPAEADGTRSYAQGFRKGAALRAERPDVRVGFRGVTNADGLVAWTVAPEWKAGYRYTIKTETSDPETYSRVESSYSLDGLKRELKALVYTDRPLYRPGDRVSFKAILRLLDGEGLRSYDGREALLEFESGGRTLLARSFPVNAFGTTSGSFELPDCARIGDYWARVNNGPPRAAFKVEAYRKPEFEIAFHHPPAVRAGQAAEVEILVHYYTGDPVADAPVLVTLSSAPSAASAMSAATTRDWPAEASDGPADRWRDVESRRLATDAHGRCVFRFSTDEGIGARYAVRARVREESTHRMVVRSTGLEATGEVAAIRVETDRPTYFPGEAARLRFRLGEEAATPSPGAAPSPRPAAATLRLEERKPSAKPFAAVVALDRSEGSCDYTVPEEDRDLAVGVRSGETWVWTPVRLRVLPRPERNPALSVAPDRAMYRVGDTATLRVRSSEPDPCVLLVFATDRIHHYRLVRVPNTELAIPIPIGPRDVPNIGVLAIAVRADRVIEDTTQIRVPPIDRFLTVEVETDRTEYRPGQDCAAVVKVLDAEGRPVADCEISLGVVDEAVYALREDETPDLREYFHRYERPLAVRRDFFFKESFRPFFIWKAPTFVKGLGNVYDVLGVGLGSGGGGRYGGRFGGRESLVAGGGGAAGSSFRARSDFKDTAFWEAHLKTGADGKASAKFAFPENLTAFRFTARGITPDHKVGAVRMRAVVRKPFYVRLATPRVLQEGNAVVLSGIVHNDTGRAQSVRVSFAGPYPVIDSTAPESLEVAPGAIGKVEYRVSADRYRRDAAFTFGARTETGEADAMTVVVPGLRRGAPFSEGRSGSAAGGEPKEEVFRLPPGAVRGTISLTLTFDAGLHSAIVEALGPLIQFPYGCVEQTMSRFLPAVAAGRALGQTPHRWSATLPTVVAQGLLRLYAFQHADGGWGWWEHDETNEAMTAYVLYGLAQCKKAGVGVDKGAADRAAALLRSRLEKRIFEGAPASPCRVPLPCETDLRAYAVLALAEYESAWSSPTVATRRLAGALSGLEETRRPIDEILLALACLRIGMTEEADRLAARTEPLSPSDVPTAAFLLQLQAARRGDVGKAVRLLLSRRAGAGWPTTMQSAYAILGLASILERSGPIDGAPSGRVRIEANGVPVREVALPDRADSAFDGRVSIAEPEAGWGDRVVVRLQLDGKGTAFYTAALEGTVAGEDLPAVERGLAVSREYFVKEGGAWAPVVGAIRAGSDVLVHVQVKSPAARAYVMATDPRPDGFEPIDEAAFAPSDSSGRRRVVTGLSNRVDLSAGWAERLDDFRLNVRGSPARESEWALALFQEIVVNRRFQPEARMDGFVLPPPSAAATIEHRDDRTIFFVNDVPEGVTHLYYQARAEFPGRLRARAPRAAPMYEPEIFGAGVEDRLTVADGRLIADPRRPDDAPLAPGVEGLPDVIRALGRVDADTVIALLPAQPKIGDLLMSVMTEPALRAWLSAEASPAGGGRELRARIEAARRDIRTRRLCAEALLQATREPPRAWLPAVEEAMRSDALARRVWEGDGVGDVGKVDNVLEWVREDRALRLNLLAVALRMRGTAATWVEGDVPLRQVTVSQALARLGVRAPTGGALPRWKLAQRMTVQGMTLTDFLQTCRRELELDVKIVGPDPPPAEATAQDAPVSRIFDLLLGPSKLVCRVGADGVEVGRLEDVVR